MRSKPPPAALMSLVNPLMRAAVKSRLGPRLGSLAVLRFTGRRTGIRRDIVAGVHDVDGVPTVFTDRPWRLSFRGGADVIVIRGRNRQEGRAELVEDGNKVGPALATAVRHAGARSLGLAIAKGAHPAPDDFAAVGRSMIRISIAEAARPDAPAL